MGENMRGHGSTTKCPEKESSDGKTIKICSGFWQEGWESL
jgi:hypothetical protein